MWRSISGVRVSPPAAWVNKRMKEAVAKPRERLKPGNRRHVRRSKPPRGAAASDLTPRTCDSRAPEEFCDSLLAGSFEVNLDPLRQRATRLQNQRHKASVAAFRNLAARIGGRKSTLRSSRALESPVDSSRGGPLGDLHPSESPLTIANGIEGTALGRPWEAFSPPSLRQQERALARANAVRVAGAEVRREVRAGVLALGAALGFRP